ncbi:ABC transporter substrate-binding protein [Rhizobium sp. R693]|uniref:ABC transporter substrate-binding protein n=1 Tax=Rhizobium sp. R693 TaxID=1764276 RepID=UPI001AEF57EA|nr:ABC transporter substrate-binding protein [Rhizobium sp. R693]
MTHKWIGLIMSAGLISVAASAPAHAGKDDGVARIVLNGEVGTLNYYFDSSREGLITGLQIYDGLVYRDPTSGEFKGDLAESWSWRDDKTIEFKLRKGVKFSNGEAFDADDVVFTINYIVDPANKIVLYDWVKWMKSAEKVDAYTVRLHLAQPYAMAMAALSGFVPMYPKDYYEKVGVSGMAAMPVGTGPYKVTAVTPGSGYTLEQNPNYFDGPKAKPAIEKIEVRTIRDVNTQLAELMSGNLDFMWQFPSDIANNLASTGEFNVTSKPGLRVGFLALDAAGRTSEQSPLKDVRVRRAINYAIDRKGIVEGLLQGGSETINSLCNPAQFGCDTNVQSYEYDPIKAKELLKEAGYPDGFKTAMGVYRDRPLAEAIVSNLASVGIGVSTEILQYSALTSKRIEGKMPISFLTDGSSSIADVAAITPIYFGLSSQDYAQDKVVAGDLQAGGTTVDEGARKAAYSRAFNRIADQAYVVPLWSYTVSYALSKDLKFEPTPDELLRFFDMAWN